MEMKEEYALCKFSMRYAIDSANVGNFPYNGECYSSICYNVIAGWVTSEAAVK